MPNPVLVLDGGQRSFLAVVRSLSLQRMDVLTEHADTAFLASTSRYCAGQVELASPLRTARDSPHAVMEAAKPLKERLILPAGTTSMLLLVDLDNLLFQLRGKGTAASTTAKLAVLGLFGNFFDSETHSEVLRRDDMAPFRLELRQWIRAVR